MNIILYTTPGCSYCRRAKQLLARRGLAYRELDLGADDAARDELVRLTGRTTFPQLLIDGRPIGGYSELETFVETELAEGWGQCAA